jgi:PleD family two-component response regulator
VTEAGALQISMSFGLLISEQWGVRSVEELLQETDAALCSAKAGGRNCIRLAKPAVPREQAREPPAAREPVALRR